MRVGRLGLWPRSGRLQQVSEACNFGFEFSHACLQCRNLFVGGWFRKCFVSHRAQLFQTTLVRVLRLIAHGQTLVVLLQSIDSPDKATVMEGLTPND